MARSITDARQVTIRQFLQQLANAASYAGTSDAKPANQSELDNLLASIDAELTPLLRLSASSTPNLVVSVGAALLTNPESARSRSIPHIGALLPNNFSSGTITFPASSGGTITVSPGNNGILTVSSGNYIKVLIYMDATGALNVLPGVENAVEANASVLAAPKKTLPIGYVTLQNVAGTIQPVAQNKIVQFGTGAGGSGSGTGSGVGDDLNALTFKASFLDEFDDIPSGSASAVDISAGKTDSTTYSAANAYYRLAYDASKTVTGTGTAMTMSGAPTFTVKIGDVLRVGAEVRRITAVGSQTSYTIESAFSANPSAAAATVSQAVYTKDLNNITLDGLAISSAFASNIAQVMVDYEDTVAADDVIYDPNVLAVVGFSASSDGTNYSEVATRPVNYTDSQEILDLPTAGTNLYIRFFSNKTSGSGFVNILKYKAFLHRDIAFADGNVMNQSYAFTDGSGTEINATISVVSGKTRIQFPWSYPVGLNPGTTNGALKGFLQGQKIPRYIDAILTPDASYKEIDQHTVELDSDYSLDNFSVEFIQDVGGVDNIDTNTTNISSLNEVQQKGFQAFVDETAMLNPTPSVGAPAAGTFHSTVVGRAQIPDLKADLKAAMGISRHMTQQIIRLQKEYGPAGQLVFSSANDPKQLIRFVGKWFQQSDNNGQSITTVTNNAYAEITFYGTGLNLVTYSDAGGADARASVDGGSEGSNIIGTTTSVLAARDYSQNLIKPAVSGLPLGLHTVKIRLNSTILKIYGYEVVNEQTAIKVNPGAGYVSGRKLNLNSQQTIPYASGFDSGSLGSRGGRVSMYLKADGTVGKALTPVGAQLNLASANHSNEEIIRSYYWREFGNNTSIAGDFSGEQPPSSQLLLAYALDDGTTKLETNWGWYYTATPDILAIGPGAAAGAANITFTFVGTGLDVKMTSAVSVTTYALTIIVDGVTIATDQIFTGDDLNDPGLTKIVSGLPYGTHVVSLVKGTGGAQDFAIKDFVVYGPKKPSIPQGAIELADYNIMADYVQNTSTLNKQVSTGTLRKSCEREFSYINGSWFITTVNPDGYDGAFLAYSPSNGAVIKYTFFGTGVEMRGQTFTGNSTNISVDVDGVAPSNGQVYTNAYWSYSSGVLDQSTGGTSGTTGALMAITGLPLGLHTITLTNNQAAQMTVSSFNVITPIHTAKSNLYSVVNNTLPVGSEAILDTRSLTPIKEPQSSRKSIAKAVGIFGSPTTGSTILVPMPDMHLIIETQDSMLDIDFKSSINVGPGVQAAFFQIFVDGQPVDKLMNSGVPNAGGLVVNVTAQVPVSKGIHRVAVHWAATSGFTVYAQDDRRILTAKEL